MNLQTISKTRIAFFYISWWTVLEVLETYALRKTFQLDWRTALIDALNTNLLIATCGYFMYSALNYYRPSLKNAMYLIVWSMVMTVSCVLLHNYLLSHYLLNNDEAYQKFLEASTIMRGLFCWLMIALIVIISYTWYSLRDQVSSEKREQDAMKLAREAELTNLRQQLQPHFLFNSLNSISALAGSRPEEARKMVQQLSDFLRGTIRRDDQQMVTLKDELNHLNLYLEIEKVRFGHRLRTEVESDDDISKLVLPSLLLQPIVENAIKFGLYDTIGEITIRIIAEKEDQSLKISVENPFDPTTASPKQGTGFGLQSIQRRLYLLFARQDLLNTTRNENIFTTIVKNTTTDMIKAILIDDEPLARSIVREYLQSHTHVEVVQECNDGFEGVKAITQHKPDLVFLDIQMPKINGFEMLELIDQPPSVIFTTAFDEYAMKAFEAHAVDYLLKPFSKERFDKALQKWQQQLPEARAAQQTVVNDEIRQLEERTRVVVKEAGNIRIIPVNEIQYIEAYDDYVKIYTTKEMFLKKKTMGFYEQSLSADQFIRVHRSYIIQLNQLTRIEPLEKDSHVALLKSGVRIPLSKTGYMKLKGVLGL